MLLRYLNRLVKRNVFKVEAESLASSLTEFFSDADLAVESFVQILKLAISEAGGKIKNLTSSGPSQRSGSFDSINCHKKPSDAVWWDEECSRLIDLRRKALAVFKSCPNLDNLRSFKSTSKEVSSSLNKIKNDSFKSFISSLNPSRPIIENFRFIKKF